MKKAICLVLTIVLLCALLLPASAYTAGQLNTADALYQLGLFLGTGSTYALDQNLTREQGITLLVRMLGKESEAKAGEFTHPFTDVTGWAEPYVGYAYENKITDGTSATTFGGAKTMTDQMFLTLCLRAMGYADKGDDPDFSYGKVWDFAYELGLVESSRKDDSFTRGETVEVFWKLLNTKMKGSSKTLAESLIEMGVFTKDAWKKASSVQANGIEEGDKSGESEPRAASTSCEHKNVVSDPATAAGCTTTGRTEGSHCADCGAVIKAASVVPALGHDYANGVCRRCGAKESGYHEGENETPMDYN